MNLSNLIYFINDFFHGLSTKLSPKISSNFDLLFNDLPQTSGDGSSTKAKGGSTKAKGGGTKAKGGSTKTQGSGTKTETKGSCGTKTQRGNGGGGNDGAGGVGGGGGLALGDQVVSAGGLHTDGLNGDDGAVGVGDEALGGGGEGGGGGHHLDGGGGGDEAGVAVAEGSLRAGGGHEGREDQLKEKWYSIRKVQ